MKQHAPHAGKVDIEKPLDANGNLRLECLRLAVRPGFGPDEVIALAERYLLWVQAADNP